MAQPEAAVKSDVIIVDLDAVEPAPGVEVKFEGKTYHVLANLDIPLSNIESLLLAQAELQGKPWHEQLSIARRQVRILVPELDDATIARMTGRKLIQIMVMITGLIPQSVAP